MKVTIDHPSVTATVEVQKIDWATLLALLLKILPLFLDPTPKL